MLARPIATAACPAEPPGGTVCDALLAEHLQAVVERYGGAGLGLIDLPPLTSGAVVPQQVGVAAVLYWCRELERAGLLPFVEALAEQVARGVLPLPIGRAARHLMPFWRSGRHRFTAPEREALYARIFDGAGDGGFEAGFAQLVEWLSRIGRERQDRGIVHLQVRAGQTALVLAQDLSNRAVGIAAFAARDIVAQIRRALQALADPELARALGGGPPWSILRRWGRRLLGHSPDVGTRVTRAEAGLGILRWLAASAPDPSGAARGIGRGHPLVELAERWRAAGGGGV